MRDDHLSRVSHAAGRSYPDLVRVRSGDALGRARRGGAPRRRAGGGGRARGLRRGRGRRDPVRRGHERGGRGRGAARRATRRPSPSTCGGWTRYSALDRTSLTAPLEPGIIGPALEQRLAAEGLTLGHFPQSFEFSTVGGWVATRSAGQASTGYGRIDELVEAVEMQTPAGPLGTRDVPASAAGPSLRELVVGSEGMLGVITSATLAVRPAPESAPLRGLVVQDLRGGRRGPARDGAGGRLPGRGPPLGRGGDAPHEGAGLERQPGREGRQPLPRPARPRGRPASRSRASRASRTTWLAAAAAPPSSCAPPGGSRSASGPDGPGCAGASRRRTCATTCSTAA